MLVRRFSTRAPPEGFGESFTRQVGRVRSTKIYTFCIFVKFWWLVLDVFLPFFDRVGISLKNEKRVEQRW